MKMNKKAKGGAGMFILVLLLLGAGYYFFIMDNGSHNPFKSNTCQTQTQTCSCGNKVDLQSPDYSNSFKFSQSQVGTNYDGASYDAFTKNIPKL